MFYEFLLPWILEGINNFYFSSNFKAFLAHLAKGKVSFIGAFHKCFLPSFGSFGQAVSEEKILKNRSIRNKNCLWWPCLLINLNKMSNLQRGPSIDAWLRSSKPNRLLLQIKISKKKSQMNPCE
jgi:hypothetical protein